MLKTGVMDMQHLWKPREVEVNLSTNEHWIDYATADGASWSEDLQVDVDSTEFELKQQDQPN